MPSARCPVHAVRREQTNIADVTDLLTVDENVLAALQGDVDALHGTLEMGSEIVGFDVEDVHAIAIKALLLERRQPGNVQYLDEDRDVVLAQNRRVHHSAQGAEVECAGCDRRLVCGEDEVHRRTHRLGHLRRHIRKADHRVRATRKARGKWRPIMFRANVYTCSGSGPSMTSGQCFVHSSRGQLQARIQRSTYLSR